jgi:hypothetical protein
MGKTAQWFSDWLVSNSVSYFKYLSRDVAGVESYDASTNLTCYLDETIVQLTNYRNEEVVSDAQIFIDGANSLASGITENDKFVLPDGEDRYPQKIRKYYDETGAMDYLIVYV